MSFLATLYLAGLSAIALPIVLHMIRRTPRGRMPFSTLMFLSPSPPRVTHRSRIEHWLLLLLRAAAVALLAFAFSRPFIRQTEEQAIATGGRRIALLIDVSASMRRTGVWEQVLERVNPRLKDIQPTDSVALFAFDSELKPLLSFNEWQNLTHEARLVVLREQLKSLSPSWKGTDLAKALTEAVAAIGESNVVEQPRATEIVVVSDFQQGSRLERLQGFQWPDGIVVRPEFLKANSETNAGLHPVAGSSSSEVRVRIDNTADSATERFRLQIVPVRGGTTAMRAPADDQEATVPAGQNRVLRVGEPSDGVAWKVTLGGDKEDFDNSAWFVHTAAQRVSVAYFGNDPAGDPQHLRFFIERAFIGTPEREVEVLTYAPEQPLLATDRPALAFVASRLEPPTFAALQKLVEDGLTVIVVASDADGCAQALQLAGREAVEVSEAKPANYAMLSSIDFEHPLFSEFSDAKLADFTKLPIWKHRVLDASRVRDARVLAQFDGEGSRPALIEMRVGEGAVILSAFGWHGDDSRFVLWSKFVPMLNHLLDHSLRTSPRPRWLTVGDALPLGSHRASDNSETAEFSIATPSGKTVSARSLDDPVIATEPGIYVVTRPDSEPIGIAVNLDPLESRTTALRLDELRAAGLPVGDATPVVSPDALRQLQSRELEARQRLWQWLIAAAVVILMLETWVAGRIGRRGQPETLMENG